MNYKFKNIILVGYSKHAKNKIIPAITKLKLKIICIVSSQNIKNTTIPVLKSINNIEKNNFIKEETIIFLCTPPKVHYKQIKFLFFNKYNIYVEKPAFIREQNIDTFINKNKTIIVENFMYQHTKIYNYFLKFWKQNTNNIFKIEMNFIIPEVPKNTFRDNDDYYNSYIFDIGCYPISLLSKLNLKLKKIKYEISLDKDKFKNITKIVFNSKKIMYEINIGVNKSYQNNVILHYNKFKSIKFNYFFYGPEKIKKICFSKNNKINKIIKIKDLNGFIEILKIKRSIWKKNQNNRLRKMQDVVYSINKISKQYISLNNVKS